jgi:serine protease Do
MRLVMPRLICLALVLMAFAWAIRPAAATGILDPDLADMVAKLLPSCVNITTTRYKEAQEANGKLVMVQDAETNKRRTFGSGLIITADGYVITNKHVTRNGIGYAITLHDGREFPADLVAEAGAFDLAVLKIRSNETWQPVRLGDSDKLREGDPVIAIGNPLGYKSTVSTGIVSALNRDEKLTPFDNFIQTDAAINQGNSGGPLFNRQGEVIGVNTAIYTTGNDTGNIGIGLAIPINDAHFVIRHMKDVPGSTSWRPAYLGATVQSLTPALAGAYGLPGPWGAIVTAIEDGSPAAQAGLREGDVVTRLGDEEIEDNRALLREVLEAGAGTAATVEVWRGGRPLTIPVTLANLPADRILPEFLPSTGIARPDVPPEAAIDFGLRLASITPELRAQYKLGANADGVLVTALALGSEAADLEVNAGSVITRVREASVKSPEDFRKAVDAERQQKRRVVPLLISGTEGRRWVPFNLAP